MWYRTSNENFEDDQYIPDKVVHCPALMVSATKDPILTEAFTQGMEKFVPNLSRATVSSSHWVMSEKPDDLNHILLSFLARTLLSETISKL